MKSKLLIFFTIINLISVLFTGCTFASESTLDGAQAYMQAVENLYGNSFLANVSKSVTIDTGIETLTETSIIKMIITDYKTPNMRTESKITVSSGNHSFSAEEVYTNLTSYLCINDGFFSAEILDADYATRHLAPALFDPEQYEDIQCRKEKGKQLLGFSLPVANQSIAIPESARLIDSTSSAILLADGSLFESSHSTVYAYEAATVACTVTARIDMQSNLSISAPKNTEEYTTIAHINAPLLLETACTRLLGAPSVYSDATYDIQCEVGSQQRIQKTATQVRDSSDGFFAQVDTQVDWINQNLHGTIDSFSQTETFSNGKYAMISNNANNSSENVTEDAMRSYCMNNLVSSVMLPQYIREIQVSETESSYLLTIQATETLAQLLFSNAYQSLYGGQESPDTVMDSYETQSVSGHIEISKHTGLPLCAGMEYIGIGAIDDAAHSFRVNIEAQYSYH